MPRLYGKCVLNKGKWEITAEPQVMIRLRRVFPTAGQQLGTVKLSDTEEICHELCWFFERYPMEVYPLDYMEDRSELYVKGVHEFDKILSGKVNPRPFDLAVPARKYQQVAAALWTFKKRLIIADDVGLGKTATAICGLTDPSTRPALVVTLTHLPTQWEREIKKFAPSISTHIIKKGKPYDIVRYGKSRGKLRCGKRLDLKEISTEEDFPDVLIINYHKLHGWAESLQGVVKTVIFDEVQELRRDESAKYTAAHLISSSCEYAVGLSATPIYNYGGEMYNVVDVVSPHVLGTRKEFRDAWCRDSSYMDKNKILLRDPNAFGRYLTEQGIMIRRTRKDVGRELPPLVRILHVIDADMRALDKVSDRVAELARLITSDAEDIKGFDKMRASEELSWRLRQATGVAKAPYAAAFIEMLLEQEEKVLVYAWHREVYSILEDKLAKYKPVLYTGSETGRQKDESAKAFREGDARVLLMSLRSGAGLDGLQHACKTIVYAELDWSPGVHEQADGRVGRDGQQSQVMCYYLMSESGSDPVVSEALGLKEQQVDGIRNPNQGALTKKEVDPDRVRRLAEAYLEQKGKKKLG